MPCEEGPGEVRTGFAANGGEPLDEMSRELASELVSSARPGCEDSDPSSFTLLCEDATPSNSSTKVERCTRDGAATLCFPGAEPPCSEVLFDEIETVKGVPLLGVDVAAIARERMGRREQDAMRVVATAQYG